jgi:SAM-dependent methyltransferase
MNQKMKSLYKEYPWLKITTTIKEYVAPEYYNRLLKDYTFDGKKDTQFFEEFLKSVHSNEIINALELGCGSGRATKVFIDSLKTKEFKLELVDLSKRMLDFSQKKFRNRKNLEFFESDSIAFLEKTSEVYDIIFSFWSFSHSVHQILIKKGYGEGKMYIQKVIRKVIKENMKRSSKFFLIHFDSLSEEQKILMKQWNKVFPIYNNLDSQSPSKLLITEVLEELCKEGLIKLRSNYFEGDAITYLSTNEALEVFLNFHMESYFNENSLLPDIIGELENYFRKFTDKDGRIKIKPGCFIYEVERNG